MTADMIGDSEMSISLERYLDDKFSDFNAKIESVQDEVKTFAEQLRNMPCSDHNEKLTKMEQKLENGDRFGEKTADDKHKKTMEHFSLWKLLISGSALAILALQVLRAFGFTK